MDYIELVAHCHDNKKLCFDEKFFYHLAQRYRVSKYGFLGIDSVRIRKGGQFQIASDAPPYLRYLHVLLKNASKKQLETIYLEAVSMGFLDVVIFMDKYGDTLYLRPLAMETAKDKKVKKYLQG